MGLELIELVPIFMVFILYFLGMPIVYALFGSTFFYFTFIDTTSKNWLILQKVMTSTQSFSMLAIPFFVMAGSVMNYGGISDKMMDFAEVLTGHMKGGLAQVNVVLSMLMGGCSGSANADCAMQSKMLVPEMEAKGIGRAFSTVVTAASSMITPLIPPGIGLILYGCIANVSIGKLFIAGFGPGILLCATMMFMVSKISKKRGYLPLRKEKMTGSMFWTSFKPAILPLCLPIIIIGGVRLGIFTATEAGAVAIVYAAVLGFGYRELGPNEIRQGLKETLMTTSSIMLIVAAASTFSWILTKEMIPQMFTQWMISVIHNKWIFLVAVDIFLIFVGMFVEGNASMIVLVPLFAPAATAYGIDPIHFAMVFIFANAIGAFTPPMGTLMFVTCGVTKCSTKDFIKEAVPFYALLFGCLLILTFIPICSTGLVNIIY